MLIRNPTLNESHFVSNFVGFMKDEIKPTIKIFKPQTLKVVVEKGKMQEKSLEALERRNRVVDKPNFKERTKSGSKTNVFMNLVRTMTSTRGHVSKTNTYRVNQDTYNYRRAN